MSPAVLLIAHGSREASANDDLKELARRLAAGDRRAIVEFCFLELAEPDIATGGAICVDRGADRVLMIPYFLSSGIHLRRDLTKARDDLAARFPTVSFRLARALGPHPLLDEIVLERVREAEANLDVSIQEERSPRIDVDARSGSG